jgi:hypothetical protein
VVVVCLAEVSLLVSVTFAAGTNAPVASVTVPWTLALNWALAEMMGSKINIPQKKARTESENSLNMDSPPCRDPIDQLTDSWGIGGLRETFFLLA